MKPKILRISLLCLAMGTLSTAALSDSSKPTCGDQPELRDCVKVEDPDAAAPSPSVHRKPKPPGAAPRPLPAPGGAKAK